MSKAYSFFLISALFLFAVNNALAAGVIHFPTGPAAWTIAVGTSQFNTKAPNLGANNIQKVEVTQNDEVSCHVVTYFSGISRPTWGVVGTSLVLTEDPTGNAFMMPSSKFFFIPFLPSSFDWLTPEMRQEKTPVLYEGKQCFHYKSTTGEAWVDSKTSLPVAVDDGSSLVTFTFHDAPSTPLVMPAKYKTILDAYARVMGIHRAPQSPN